MNKEASAGKEGIQSSTALYPQKEGGFDGKQKY
jgi:hypothetical protein